jgi:hypothetical protein
MKENRLVNHLVESPIYTVISDFTEHTGDTLRFQPAAGDVLGAMVGRFVLRQPATQM